MGFAVLLVIRKVLKKITLLRKIWFWIRFIKNNRYIPDFKNPKTYNEKINFRKRDPRNPLFSICADKVKAKEYVSDRISSEIIIPSYYVGDSIDLDQMKAIIAEYGDCFLKANHNSGAVYLLTTSSTESEIQAAVDSVSEQLKDDFGLLVNEPWYSNIQRKVLVEMRLRPSPGEVDIRDYKFHVFKQLDGGFKIILEVHYDQKWNHNISYFTEDLKWLPITIEYPNIVTQVEAPANYGVMLEYARKLAEPFSYVRVDFYNVNGAIYFGELTFAKTSGAAVFINRMYDLWLGNFWQGDRRS